MSNILMIDYHLYLLEELWRLLNLLRLVVNCQVKL